MQVEIRTTEMSASARDQHPLSFRWPSEAPRGICFPLPSTASATSVTPISNHPLDYARTLPDRTCTGNLLNRI